MRFDTSTSQDSLPRRGRDYQVGSFRNGRIRVDSPIELPVSAAEAWKTLGDLAAWKSWNRVLFTDSGAAPYVVGRALRLKCRQRLWRGIMKTTYFDVMITELEPGRRIVWEGRHLGTLGRHGYEIIPVDANGSRLNQWEEIYGVGALVARRIGVLDAIGWVHTTWNRAFLRQLGAEPSAKTRSP